MNAAERFKMAQKSTFSVHPKLGTCGICKLPLKTQDFYEYWDGPTPPKGTMNIRPACCTRCAESPRVRGRV